MALLEYFKQIHEGLGKEILFITISSFINIMWKKFLWNFESLKTFHKMRIQKLINSQVYRLTTSIHLYTSVLIILYKTIAYKGVLTAPTKINSQNSNPHSPKNFLKPPQPQPQHVLTPSYWRLTKWKYDTNAQTSYPT